MNKDYSNKNFPVEYLIFQIENKENIDRFIKLDHEIWTSFLSSFPGFISKEVWVNYDTPGEIHTILIWESMDFWKNIPLDKLKLKDKEFCEKFSYNFKMTRRIHKELNHGLHKVRHFELDNNL